MGRFVLSSPAPVEPIPTPEEEYNQLLNGSRENDAEKVVQLPTENLFPFPGHLFALQETRVADLQNSIREKGIYQPLIVREVTPGQYEIIAGHHRWQAAVNEGLKTVPASIKDLSDDEAELMMIDTNIQRGFGELKYSERAKALKKRFEILSRQGQRTDLLGETPYDCNKVMQGEAEMSPRNIRRYLALNHLIPALMEALDHGKISLVVGVELSFLTPENQEKIADFLEIFDKKITLEQAENLKELERENNFPAILPDFFDPPKAAKTRDKTPKTMKVTIKLDDIQDVLSTAGVAISDKKELKTYILNAVQSYCRQTE